MAWRPHGRASVDRKSPKAWAVCDDCGFLFNHQDLSWQFEWYGNRLQNTRFLKCPECLDVPQEQVRTIILPADPEPIMDPRPERSDTSDPGSVLNISNNALNSQGVIGTLTQGASLKAAFDGNVNKPFFLSAARFVSLSSPLGNTIGKNWTGINSSGTIPTGFTVTAPNNAKILGGGAAAYAFQGSNDQVVWTTLASGTTLGTVGEVVSATFSSATTPYLFTRFAVTGDGVTSVSVAQLAITISGVGTTEV